MSAGSCFSIRERSCLIGVRNLTEVNSAVHFDGSFFIWNTLPEQSGNNLLSFRLIFIICLFL